MAATLVLIPKISVHPDKITFYNEVNWHGQRKLSYSPETGEEVQKIKYDHLLRSARTANGNVSQIAKRKIAKAIEYLLTLTDEKKVRSRFSGRAFSMKVAFVTLTLPSTQIHTDKEIKEQCLNQFIIEIKKYYHVRNYVWRAEKQKNGNLHFHILIDKFIPWSELRNRWNRICNKLGYVDRYRDEMRSYHAGGFHVRKNLLDKWDYKHQIAAYKKGVASDWNSPNSTDVHSTRKIGDLKKYMIKYLTKNEQIDYETGEIENEFLKVSGRIWGSTQSLSNPTGARMVVDSQIETELSNALDASGCDCYYSDYFSVFFIRFDQLTKYGAKEIFSRFCEYLASEFDFNYQLRI